MLKISSNGVIMNIFDKRFDSTENAYPGFYPVTFTQTEQLEELSHDPNSSLELAVVLRRFLRNRNWPEITNNVPMLLKLVKTTDEHARYECLLALNYLCLHHSSHLSFYLIFKDVEDIIAPTLNSQYKELRLQAYKLLSILIERKYSEDYLAFLDIFEEYLQLNADEEAMAYIMEIAFSLFEQLSEDHILRFTTQASGILEKAADEDLISYCMMFLNSAFDYSLEKFAPKAVEAKICCSLLSLLSDHKHFEMSFGLLKKISASPETIPAFKELLPHLISLLTHNSNDVKYFASNMLVNEAAQGFEHLENMINKNFIPTLVIFLTSQDQRLKYDMILIVKFYFRQQLQHQIIELLENNVVNILCRIIERDQANRVVAIECMDLLLNGGNEIFKSFADSCRLSRLLTQVGTEENCNAIACRILARHYPRAPLPKLNVQVPPAVSQGLFGSVPAMQAPGANPSLFTTTSAPHAQAANLFQGVQTNTGTIQNLPLPVANTVGAAKPNNAFNLPKGKKTVLAAALKDLGGTKLIPKKTPVKKTVTPRPKPIQKANPIAKAPGKAKAALANPKSVTVFPVSRVFRRLKLSKLRVSRKAAVYLSGVFDYLCGEVMDLAMNVTVSMKRKIIMPKDILQALREDFELDKLTSGIILPESGNTSSFPILH